MVTLKLYTGVPVSSLPGPTLKLATLPSPENTSALAGLSVGRGVAAALRPFRPVGREMPPALAS
ncbi:MAG: hypothetical protein RR653_03170 [Clostridia bacterium]